MLQLPKYDLDMCYVSGKDVPISDLMSKSPSDTDTFTLEGLDLHVHTVLLKIILRNRL